MSSRIELHANESLVMRLRFFIEDLLSNNSERLNYLSRVNPEYYFPVYYFTEDEIEYLLSLQLSNGSTYRESFKEFIKDKTILCTSHDIAPFVYTAFGITMGNRKDTKFKTAHKRFRTLKS
jgi:hypothetical protein